MHLNGACRVQDAQSRDTVILVYVCCAVLARALVGLFE